MVFGILISTLYHKLAQTIFNMVANHIPVIDISKLDKVTGESLVEAVHKWGFAFVKGSDTGFTGPMIDHIFQLVYHTLH